METGKPPPSRPVVSAGSGQNDHLSEIISHILEPIVKMRPGGMEMTSTGDFRSVVDGINKKVLKTLTWKKWIIIWITKQEKLKRDMMHLTWT